MYSKKYNVKKLRRQYGMTQDDLAERLGLSRQTLIKIEKDERELTMPEKSIIEDIFDMVKAHTTSSDVRISIPKKHLDKFKQVLLYILEKTAGKPNVGMTVLYKLLYFIDFDYYEKYEEQLMGLTYIKNHHGPTPREFVKVVEEMKKNGELEEVQSRYFTYEQKKYLPHVRADLSLISGQELDLIDDVLARYADKTASELSSITHADTPWASADDGENIEYDHVFYRPDSVSVREYEKL